MRDAATALRVRSAPCIAIAALLAGGCAQVREITGGPKDEQGPSFEEASPPMGSVHFSDDRFVMRFNERVQVKRPKGGLLVSPPMDPPPSIAVSGAREVTVSWKGELRPNVTYSFAVGEAIADLAEGNAARGLTYVLSTGDAVDSLEIHGTVTHAFTGAEIEDALVLAYEEGDSAAFTQGRPAYITRTDKEGRYALTHLPERGLRIAALKDLNGNYRFDLPAEEIAFALGAVMPSASSDSTRLSESLRLFQEASTVQRILNSNVTEDRALRMVLALPAERIALRDIAREGGKLTWSAEWSTLRDTVLLWPSDTTALGDGRYAVSTEAGALDTLRYRPLRPMPFVLDVKAKAKTGPGKPIRLRASRPLSEVNEKAILLRMDSTEIPFSALRDTSDSRALLIVAKGELPQNASLTLLPKALRDIYDGTNDTLRFAAGMTPTSAFGTLRLTLEGGEGLCPCIVELLDARGTVVRRAMSAMPGERVSWERIEPGNHSLRLIADTNGNGRWDAGRWAGRRPPERVLLHAEPVNVRAAWDLGITWKVKPE